MKKFDDEWPSDEQPSDDGSGNSLDDNDIETDIANDALQTPVGPPMSNGSVGSAYTNGHVNHALDQVNYTYMSSVTVNPMILISLKSHLDPECVNLSHT